MKVSPIASLVTVLAFAASAQAQSMRELDQVQMVARTASTVAAGFGQSLGEGVSGGSSVFVVATGQADLPAPAIDIEGKAATATEAARLRDARLDAVRAIAQRLNVDLGLGVSSFSHEEAEEHKDSADDSSSTPAPASAGSSAPPPLMVAPVGAASSSPPAAPAGVFTARTGVWFRVADPHQLPALLDALAAAKIDVPFPVSGGEGAPVAAPGGAPGSETTDAVYKASWALASQNAIASAQRQASVLATAAGRKLGEAKNIQVLTGSTLGGKTSITVAVRYAFASGK